MIGNAVHLKDEKVIKNLSNLTETITNNLSGIQYLNSVMDIYKESKPEYIPVLQSIKTDHLAENAGSRQQFFAAVRDFLMDQSPDFPAVMKKKVLIGEIGGMVVDHLMEPLMRLFERFFSKVEHSGTFVVQFEEDSIQGLDILSMHMEINSLIRELGRFEVLGFVLISKHDPQNLIITFSF